MKNTLIVLLSTITLSLVKPLTTAEGTFNFIKKVIIVPEKKLSELEKHVLRYSNEYHIDPVLVFAMIKVESKNNQFAKSNKGALGVLQLMPSTAKWLNVNPLILEDNIKGGVKYLSMNMRKYKNTRLALAAYNAGPGNVDKYGRTIPPFKETINYVNKICGSYYCG